MVTREDLLNGHYGQEFHYDDCTVMVGPRGGKTYKTTRVRQNGQVKTWKTRPAEFSAPFKFGLRDCFYITPNNIGLLHTPQDCPIRDQ